jgi:hypothetical protein
MNNVPSNYMKSSEIQSKNIPFWAQGEWEEVNRETTAVYSVDVKCIGAAVEVSVSAVDREDGEIIEISSIAFSGDNITFDSLVKSSGYSANHELRKSDSENEILHFIRLKERFRRI